MSQQLLTQHQNQFAKSKADDIKDIAWDLVVLEEAHRLRNVYKTSNVIAKTLKEALAHVHSKVLLTATPLQNSLMELYGLVSIIDDRVFGDIDSFRSQFTAQPREQAFAALRTRLGPVCKRTLRRQVQQYVPYTARRAIVEEFTPSTEERELSSLVADYRRRPKLKALPEGQRPLISLVLWKLLASSTHAIAVALETMAKRLQGELDESSDVPDLADVLDEDYESLDQLEEERAEEWNGPDPSTAPPTPNERDAVTQEIAELRHFKTLATNIRDNAKGKALLTALDRAFSELERLGAAKKAIIFTESKRTQEYLLSLLADTSYGEGIVLFNGSNSDARAQAVFKDWLKRHEGTDRITGSKTADTRAALVEHFKERGTVMIATEDGAEGINHKLRVRAEDSSKARSKYERMLMDLTRAELADCATFDDDGFVLQSAPEAALDGIDLGRYELPRRSGDAHLYRIGHPLAVWVAHQAKTRELASEQPTTRLIFDYDAYGTQSSTLKAYRGKTGWLTLKLVSVEALGNKEQHLVVAASTSDGHALEEDDPEKLLRLPARSQSARLFSAADATLVDDVEARKIALLREINQRNLGYFDQEVQKLDVWVDDLKLGLEQEIKAIDAEIKEVRRTAATSQTLEEKLSWQKQQRELEARRGRLRRELFVRQDEVESQRNDLISQLEVQLLQQVVEHTLFTIEWELK